MSQRFVYTLLFKFTRFSAFHDGLDYISVHGQLIRELREPLVGTKARQSLENQVEIVVKTVALQLKPYPAFLTVCIIERLRDHVHPHYCY